MIPVICGKEICSKRWAGMIMAGWKVLATSTPTSPARADGAANIASSPRSQAGAGPVHRFSQLPVCETLGVIVRSSV